MRVYHRKLYRDWIDQAYPFPHSFLYPKFVASPSDNGQSIIEHFCKFMVKYGNIDDHNKLYLLGNSLTRMAHAWYMKLPSNSIQDWRQLEYLFHSYFFQIKEENEYFRTCVVNITF